MKFAIFMHGQYTCQWGHSKSTFTQRGEGGGVNQKRTKTKKGGGQGGLSTLRMFAFKKDYMANFVHAGYIFSPL